ncbi:TonB-dependent receptor domain-containing protein [Sphingomonas quercus]|uniref:TonB-dependent receptor n=1 Tax=Sphingomonas quercus TaxID=2842451 RepID=A0ABS6BGG5_9SPHN|nr:TonB-dependent receptor [Sphingomonas quercus]MBU3077385.1 TonB-dependent receptor [Sphingomonas quercus]
MNSLWKASIFMVGASTIAIGTQASAQAVAGGQPGGDAAVQSGVPAPAPAADASAAGEIVVTGSRVVSNGNQAPTPVTVVSTQRLLETTPSSISDGLNQLPQFAGQPSQRSIGSAQGNSSAATLNLRHFGSNRNLVLLDGNRLPPAGSGGAVDTNIIPQALVQRVEVVTGGASAVYGSDAVTGVINYILDKNFNGLKFNSQAGLSTYGDNASWRVGVAAGMPLFDGRGHIEASFDHYDSKGIKDVAGRPLGKDYWIVGGAGTQANPFRLVKNGRTLLGSPGGMIVNTTTPGLADTAFNSNGVPTPFIHGASSGVNGIESGGDGGYYDDGTLLAPVRTNQAFARFDYEITNDISAYVQGSYSDSAAKYPYASARYVADILSGNPFIPASIQQIMTQTGTKSIQVGRLQSRENGLPGRINDPFNRNVYAMAGLKGKVFGRFDWNLNYIYSQNDLRVINHNNTYTPRYAAALDAVRDPATGRVVCQVSLTPNANLFPGCEPLNVFGPTAPSASAYDWITDDTRFKLTNRMNDVNLSVSGEVFSLWAGPVTAALSGEYRTLSLRNRSSAQAAAQPDCTGIRDAANCSASTPQWQHDVSTSMFGKQNVKEVAGELLIPLLRDVPLIQSLELNLAGRYTDYSTSGGVGTWKIGGTWQVSHELRIRGTRSRDIRAPTLNDLFAPTSISPTGFTDLHTNQSRPVNVIRQGNPDLKPEVAMTTTVGVVFQPEWIPGFSLAVDYYNIKINNAISSTSGFSVDVQRECETSNGASPLCSLLERPLPFSDRSAANFPTRVFSQSVNSARSWTRGVDVEANYSFDMANLIKSVPGRLAIRALVAYQPTLKTQTLISLPARENAGIVANPTSGGFGSKVNANLSLSYTSEGLSVFVTERWQSKQHPSDPAISFDLRPDIPAYSYTDISFNYRIRLGDDNTISPFVSIQNLFNKQPPLIGGQNNVPGLYYPTGQGFDVIGRYFTVGVKGKF